MSILSMPALFGLPPQANLLLDTIEISWFAQLHVYRHQQKGGNVYVVVAGQYPSLDLAKETSRNISAKGFDNFIARAKDSLDKGP